MALFPLGILSAAGVSGAVAPDYELIQTQILGSNQASVTFSNLADYSSTYKHLQIRAVARTAQSGTSRAFSVRVNSDTGSNYAWHLLTADGSSVASQAGSSQSFMYLGQISGTDSESNVFSASVVDVLDAYSSTKNKTFRSLAGSVRTDGNRIRLFSGFWNNTASITSLTLLGENQSSDFAAVSRFSLYGIKG